MPSAISYYLCYNGHEPHHSDWLISSTTESASFLYWKSAGSRVIANLHNIHWIDNEPGWIKWSAVRETDHDSHPLTIFISLEPELSFGQQLSASFLHIVIIKYRILSFFFFQQDLWPCCDYYYHPPSLTVRGSESNLMSNLVQKPRWPTDPCVWHKTPPASWSFYYIRYGVSDIYVLTAFVLTKDIKSNPLNNNNNLW